MLQAPPRLRLALEARYRLLHLARFEVFAEDRLHRDLALDQRVEAFVHHAHRPLAQGAGDPILADALRKISHGARGARREKKKLSRASRLLFLYQFERLLEAAAHAVERGAQHA